MATVNNVSAAKPNIDGAIYWAPAGSTLPTSATADLDAAFVELGYVSDDGVTNSNSPSSEEIKAWGGDTVLTTQTEKPDTFSYKLIEILNVNVLKAVYGADNVSGTLATGITVKANSDEVEESCWVIDMILRDGVLKRVVIPLGKLSELGDIVYKDDEAAGYEVTVTALPYNDNSTWTGETHQEFIIEAAEETTSGTSGTSGTSA